MTRLQPEVIFLSVTMNTALKVACIESGKDQLEIAELARVNYTRLSQIIRNRVTATESEKLRLAGVLQRSVDSIFPATTEAAAETTERAS